MQGEKGDTGEKGEQGIQGVKGDTGETPEISVAESTPVSYKLNFKTSEQDITTPNLFAPYSEYHADLSATNSVLNIPVGELVLTYQTTTATTLRIPLPRKKRAFLCLPISAERRYTTQGLPKHSPLIIPRFRGEPFLTTSSIQKPSKRTE